MPERAQHAQHGEVAEWSNAAVLKTVELKGSGGSNPSLSAIFSIQSDDRATHLEVKSDQSISDEYRSTQSM